MFSFTYPFDEAIEIDGIRCGYFTGSAELIEEGSSFYVARILLDGEKVERRPGFMIPNRKNCVVSLDRDSWLFNALAASIYGSRDAQEKFDEELAMEVAA
jgi:hypothetical protein